jgi:hypothetical protein
MSTQASRITYENALCAELLADLRKMVALCQELPSCAVDASPIDASPIDASPIDASPVGVLERLELILETKNEECAAFELYNALACPTILTVAADVYAVAGNKACSAQLRRVVKSIHRLGAKLDLE